MPTGDLEKYPVGKWPEGFLIPHMLRVGCNESARKTHREILNRCVEVCHCRMSGPPPPFFCLKKSTGVFPAKVPIWTCFSWPDLFSKATSFIGKELKFSDKPGFTWFYYHGVSDLGSWSRCRDEESGPR